MTDDTPSPAAPDAEAARPAAIAKDAFLQADDLDLCPVPLPSELYGEGACLYLRVMTGEERSTIEKVWQTSEKARTDPEGFRWAVISRCVVNENGVPMFDIKTDRTKVMAKNGRIVELLFVRACKHSGMTEADIEELMENSEASPES
jgi:hypothetical protein